MMQSIRFGGVLIALAPLALGASMAFAQTGKADIASAPIDNLKRVYLACDRAASRQLLDFGTAAHCSMVSEALQQRAFDGNFDRLLAWWRAEKDSAATAATAEADGPTAQTLR
jgi:hypothetical protein